VVVFLITVDYSLKLSLIFVCLFTGPEIHPQNFRGVPKKANELDIAWTVRDFCI
jgi:hypothetical protein